MNDGRLDHLKRFYSILAKLEQNMGGARTLADCSGRMDWPKRGVYFFRETGENRIEARCEAVVEITAARYSV